METICCKQETADKASKNLRQQENHIEIRLMSKLKTQKTGLERWRVCMCASVCMCVHAYVCTCVHVHVSVCACVCTYLYMCV